MYGDNDPEFDCYAILDVLYSNARIYSAPAKRASRWDFLWADLQARSSGLANRESILQAALASQLPVQFRPGNWHPQREPHPTKRTKTPADVLIVCVIEIEYHATLAALGIDQTQNTELNYFGHPFVRTVLDTDHCGQINVWITLIGKPRNLVCAHFCRDVFEYFDVRYCCILVGIAAGHPDQLKYGDVVGAKMILDIEGARVEPRGEKPRFIPYPLRGPLSETFESFTPTRWNWLVGRESAVEILLRTKARVPATWANSEPEFKTGIIVAGEKLRRDDPLPKLSDRYGDGILALDMEGAGFASACDKKNVLWLVFRGITDHGNMRKRDEWHAIAALNAATAAHTYITKWLRPVRENDDIP